MADLEVASPLAAPLCRAPSRENRDNDMSEKMKSHNYPLKIPPVFEPLFQESCNEGNLGCDSIIFIIFTNVHLIEFSKKK